MPEFTIGPQETSRNISLKVGEALTLRLEENSTTGFRWAVNLAPGDALELASSSFTAGMDTGVGAGGERVLVFRAKARGEASFTLVLRQEWMPDNPARQVLFNVAVN